MWIGFIWNWTRILVFVFTVGIKFFYVYHIAKGTPVPRFLQSRCRRVFLEILFVGLSTVVTLGYAGVPFITNNYGLAGAWCWIRALNENCTISKAGLYDQLFNGYIFYVSGSIIGLILLIVVAVVYCRLPVTHNETKLLLKKTFCVIITFLVNIVIMVFALIARVTAAVNKMYKYPPVWFSFGVTFPISLLLFPIAYLILFSVGRRAGIMSYFCRCFKRNRQTRIRRLGRSAQAATVQESNRVSAPSQTYCVLSHTNDFTETMPLNAEASTYMGYGAQLQ